MLQILFYAYFTSRVKYVIMDLKKIKIEKIAIYTHDQKFKNMCIFKIYPIFQW